MKATNRNVRGFCHALCARTAAACLRDLSLALLTSQLVLARARGHFTLAGGSCVAAASLFVRAFIRAGSPRNPRTPARARSDSLVHLLIGRFI